MSSTSFGRSSFHISSFLSRRTVLCVSAFSVALGSACPGARAQSAAPPHVTYTFTDLGTLPGDVYSVGYAINESGDVAGYSVSPSGQKRAVIFKEGKVIDLGLTPGANASVAYGINGYDQVTGELDFPLSGYYNYVSHAFLYSAGKMQDIGTLSFPNVPPEVDFGLGTAINDSGQIAGAAGSQPLFEGTGANPDVFLYSAGKLTAVPLTDAVSFFDPYSNEVGNNINASGQIAGVGAIFNSSNGSTTSLGSADATAINDSGQATGFLSSIAFLYSNGTITDIVPPPHSGPYSYGDWINASGQIVGISGDAQGADGYPFLYTPGQGITFLPLETFVNHLAINDKGQITGTQGNHAFLLSPVFVPFSTLDAVMEIAGTPRTDFAAGGRVTLGAKSNGFNPLTETVVLQLGGYHISIPPSSFVKISDYYIYQGTIGTVAVQAILRPLNARVFLFGIVGHGAAAASLPIAYPVALTLTIGDDTGTEQITSGYPGGMPTPAQVCAAFGIPCN